MNRLFSKFRLFVAALTCIGFNALAQTGDFVTVWDLSKPGSGTSRISFNIESANEVGYSWKDLGASGQTGSGSLTINGSNSISSLPANSKIELRLNPTNLRRFEIYEGVDKDKLIKVTQWGTVPWTGMSYAFYGCINLDISATDIPDLSGVESMQGMFGSCQKLNGTANMGNWDVSKITDMSFMFYNAGAFNQNIGDWDTQNVTNMRAMFQNCLRFNQDVGKWDTQKVTDMSSMFAGAISFSQDIGQWNTQSATDMSYMFEDTRVFNQDIGNWNTQNVTNMAGMFKYAEVFNRDIGNWNTQNVTNMAEMFLYTKPFNQDIGNWNTQNVTNMAGMFMRTDVFNQDISDWNTQNVTDMVSMFNGSKAFNQDIGDWDTQNVTNMRAMFAFSNAFNQDIGDWNTQNVTNMSAMFQSCRTFNQDLGKWKLNANVNMQYMLADASAMNCIHYSATLAGWYQNNPLVIKRTLGADGLLYAGNDRINLFYERGWRISGDSEATGLPTIVNENGTVTAVRGCLADFADPVKSDREIIKIDPNGNANFTPEKVTVTVTNKFIPTSVSGVSTSSSYYQISSGGQTLRLSRRLHIIAPNTAETFPQNGGVIVRVYYDSRELDQIKTSSVTPPRTIVKWGWFKSARHNVGDVIGDMSATSLANAVECIPIAEGVQNEVGYADFKMESFSTIGLFASTSLDALPVTLATFGAKVEEAAVALSWKTTAEVNSSHFDVLHSTDAKRWTTVGTVHALGYASEYHFDDKASRQGSNYYRLKMVDMDGTFAFSRIVSVDMGEDGLSLYPNPAGESLFARGLLPGDQFRLLDQTGKVLKAWVTSTSSESRLSTSSLHPGIYLIEIRNIDGSLTTKKFIKE